MALARVFVVCNGAACRFDDESKSVFVDGRSGALTKTVGDDGAVGRSSA